MKIISVERLSPGLIGALLLALIPSTWALTAVEVTQLTASSAGTYNKYFGSSVDVDGDTALIGAYLDDGSGSAYVFTRNAGVWTEQAKLSANDAARSDYFGRSVAVDGDTALIGAMFDDDNGTNSGSVYVFTRSAGEWTEQAKLTASDSGLLGISVALDGNTALIGARGDHDNGRFSGAAYVFTKTAGVWTEQAKLTASDAASRDHFGGSVALDGDTALIDSPYDDDNGEGSGAAYVFTRKAGVWTQQAKLTASDAASYDKFGESVAVGGDTILIGATFDDDNGTNNGSVYVFTRNAGVWTEQAKLTASDAASRDYFGRSVAVDGDTALIGAYHDDDLRGSAYVFTHTTGGWAEQAKLTASDAKTRDAFGVSVALDGDTALIGTKFGGHHSGSAYIFSLNPATVVTINIKPGTETNNVNPNSNGFIAVAILTVDVFDALQVDPDTAKFGPSGATAERFTVTDVDGDGDQDLLLFYRTQQTGIACTDTQATMVGELYDGSEVTGTDSVATVGCIPGAVVEAESMALSGAYAVEDNAAASGGKLIRRRDSGGYPATASTAFAGSAGSYDIEVAYFDEYDGMSSLAFLLNGEMLDQWIADEDPACRECASPNEKTLRSRVVARGVRLSPGDVVTLQGTGEHYEYARFDNITISPVNFNTLEAEKMTLGGGYAVEDNAAASGGKLIRRRDSGGYPATASTAFAGSAGSYDIEVAYFDEYDGMSSLAFLLNGEMLDQWIADEDPACRECASPNEKTLRSRVVARGVRLSPGDEVTLQGTGEHYEYARFDKITLSLEGFTTLEAETMTLDDGFVVEANAAASGGQIIRGNGPADSISGKASALFMGSKGQYDITVAYFDENDGISSLAFFLNNQLLDQWLADENPACRDCASPNERTLRSRVVATGIEISPDDKIRLESTVNQYEYGRFDKIDFTPSLSH